jgi:hypothetical protein
MKVRKFAWTRIIRMWVPNDPLCAPCLVDYLLYRYLAGTGTLLANTSSH